MGVNLIARVCVIVGGRVCVSKWKICHILHTHFTRARALIPNAFDSDTHPSYSDTHTVYSYTYTNTQHSYVHNALALTTLSLSPCGHRTRTDHHHHHL